MSESFDSARVPHDANFLWVNLTRETHTLLSESAGGAFDVHRVREPSQIPDAIQFHAPQFLCFEFDEPDTPGIAAQSDTRRAHSGLPVLMITGCHSEPLARWALRIRVWDLLVKPVLIGELSQCITTLIELTRLRGSVPARETLLPQQPAQALHGPVRQGRTHPAVSHVATHFNCKIALDQAAALCMLSPSHFCRVFLQEQGASFGQYLLRYRLERACEGLAHSGELAKEVAYSVGFNDLSYFTWAFKRQLGLTPSEYRAAAR